MSDLELDEAELCSIIEDHNSRMQYFGEQIFNLYRQFSGYPSSRFAY